MKHLFCQSGIAFSSTSNLFRHLTSCQYLGFAQITCDACESLDKTRYLYQTVQHYLSRFDPMSKEQGKFNYLQEFVRDLTQYNLFGASAVIMLFVFASELTHSRITSMRNKCGQRQWRLGGCACKSAVRRISGRNQNRQRLPVHQLARWNQINPQGVVLPSGILHHKWRAMHITALLREWEQHKSTKQV